MNDFKPGLWHLAKRHRDVQLVPVYLENLNRILPRGDFLLIGDEEEGRVFDPAKILSCIGQRSESGALAASTPTRSGR